MLAIVAGMLLAIGVCTLEARTLFVQRLAHLVEAHNGQLSGTP